MNSNKPVVAQPTSAAHDVTKSEAWTAAIERGKQYVSACISDPGNVDLASASRILGVSEAELLLLVREGRLYVFPLGEQTSEVTIPSWQLRANAHRMRIVLACFSGSNLSPFIIHNFFERTYEDLGGVSGRDAVLSDDLDIELVRMVLARSIPGEQGAL
jgi:hypothetical protein